MADLALASNLRRQLVDDTQQILDSLHEGEERLEIDVPPFYTLGALHAEGNGVCEVGAGPTTSRGPNPGLHIRAGGSAAAGLGQ
jgi:hypothetical protein